MTERELQSTSMFELHGKPSFALSLPIAFQHLLAMIVGNTLPSLVLAGQLAGTEHALTPDQQLYIIQAGFFVAGITTLIQIYPLMKVGAKLPAIMGVSFAYIPVLTSIGLKYGIGALYGSQLVGGIVAFLVGIFIKRIRKYFPPLVSGTVVLTIGLSLYSVALNYMAGGSGNPNQGDMVYWAVSVLTLVVVLICNMFGKGIVKLAAILIGILVGYIAAFFFGIVDLSSISEAGWIMLPRVMEFRLSFPPDAVLTMAIMFIVNSVQAVGDFTSLTSGGLGREPTDEELSGGIKANGVGAVLGSIFGGLPTATYSQNIGIVAMTKVVAMRPFVITAILILIAGFMPKFGAVMLTVPQAVIGGATVSVFAQITMSGIDLLTSRPLSSRDKTIAGLGIALGIGFTQLAPGARDQFPEWFNMVFGASPVVLSTVVVFFLNILIPQKTLEEEQRERDEMEKGVFTDQAK